MNRVSKQAARLHREAEEILRKPELSHDEQHFVLDHWTPRAAHIVGENGAFFTPAGLARDLAVMAANELRTVDLCAGIGRLARTFLDYHPGASLTCVELNPAFVEVGRKVAPEATWICGDVFSEETYRGLPRFHWAISNPPFGNVRSKAAPQWLKYRGPADLMVCEVGLRIASGITAILPTGSCDFEYSGKRNHTKRDTPPGHLANLFARLPGVTMECEPVDCSVYADEWDGTAPRVELASLTVRHGLGDVLPGPCDPAPLTLFAEAA